MEENTPTASPTWVPTDWTWSPTVLGVPTVENGSKDMSDVEDMKDIQNVIDGLVGNLSTDTASVQAIENLIAALEEKEQILMDMDREDDDGALDKIVEQLQANQELLEAARTAQARQDDNDDDDDDDDDVDDDDDFDDDDDIDDDDFDNNDGVDDDDDDVVDDDDDVVDDDDDVVDDDDDVVVDDDDDVVEENVPTESPTFFPSTLQEKIDADEEKLDEDILNQEEQQEDEMLAAMTLRPSLRPTFFLAPTPIPVPPENIPRPTASEDFITFDDDDDDDDDFDDDDEFDDDDDDDEFDDDDVVDDDDDDDNFGMDVEAKDPPTASPTYFPSYFESDDEDDEEVADETIGILPGPPMIAGNGNQLLVGNTQAPQTTSGSGSSSAVVMEVTKEEIEYAAIGGSIAAVVLALMACCFYMKYCRIKKGRSAKKVLDDEERDSFNLNGHMHGESSDNGDEDGFHDEEEVNSNGNGSFKEFPDSQQSSLDEEVQPALPSNKASKESSKKSSSRYTNGFSDTPPEPQGPRNVV